MGLQRKLFDGLTATGSGTVLTSMQPKRNYQLVVTGTGAVTAAATVYGSSTANGPWETLITLNASGTTTASDQGETNRQWRFTYASLTAITGTGATATLYTEESN